ncbi:MAG: hypothetical protein A2538_01045 [Candidatus Magasanikbacteria bacterium RIFOXYD2_FULL_41_14]|uniref:Sortilin N-terminal domain-containing protein n=1 Tax=Candidatus Magasanikbacteria bacterium RIFOXYD2_FULL_41_14 TaxID=1798709 RepID=A0A1F6PDY3_9BACT|nr:MAG: hypothetical protein A2538_01045 [Candidatus Magasanikbacteria bacterium RIFOXYD2_FULL_41_14]
MRRTIYFLVFSLVALVLVGAGCISGTAAGPMGVYASLDKGDSWQPAFAYPTAKGVESIADLKVYRMHIDPSDPNTIYLATRGQGLFYTYNKGETWQSVPEMDKKFIYGLAVNPVDKCAIYVSDGQHIYKTEDCSRTWNIVFTEEIPTQRLVALTIDYSNGNLVYGALLGGDVLVSRDAGKSWQVTKRFKFELQSIEVDPFVSGRVYLASQKNGLYRSDDAGVTWTDLSVGLNNYTDSLSFYRLTLNPGQRDSLFWISKYGILRSNDAGETWSDMKLLTPPGSVNIYAFAINPKNQKEIYYTGTILGPKNEHLRSTFYRTVDGGENWVTKKLPTNSIPIQFVMNTENSSQLFLGFTSLSK